MMIGLTIIYVEPGCRYHRVTISAWRQVRAHIIPGLVGNRSKNYGEDYYYYGTTLLVRRCFFLNCYSANHNIKESKSIL